MSVYMDGAQETHTSAESVGPSQDPALLDLAKRREHHSDVVLIALLRHHADEQFPVLHRCRGREEDVEMGEKQKRRRKRESFSISSANCDQCLITTSTPSLCATLSLDSFLSPSIRSSLSISSSPISPGFFLSACPSSCLIPFSLTQSLHLSCNTSACVTVCVCVCDRGKETRERTCVCVAHHSE